jgi:sRNA-binding regulator protein Hfq
MTPKSLSEQHYLDQVVSSGVTCHVWLVAGARLTGVVAAHSGGGDVLWLQPEKNPDDLCMLFIHGISTICPVGSHKFTRAPSHDSPAFSLGGRDNQS